MPLNDAQFLSLMGQGFKPPGGVDLTPLLTLLSRLESSANPIQLGPLTHPTHKGFLGPLVTPMVDASPVPLDHPMIDTTPVLTPFPDLGPVGGDVVTRDTEEVGGKPLARTPEGDELGKSYAELQGKNPDEEVVVYRASEAGGKLKPGQFVTTSREIARFYARDIVGQRGASSAKVEKHRVKASEIRLKKSQQDIGVTDAFIYEPLARTPKRRKNG